jgi:toxin ParE1/3/4
MTYRVELTVRAAHDLSHLFEEIHARESAAAARWYNELEEAVYNLERFPRRCPHRSG